MEREMAGPGFADSDVSLMLRVKEDDGASFEALYDRHYQKIQDFFYGMGRDPQLASDLCQETFLRIWKLRNRYMATGSFLGYLFTFARNIWLEKCRDFARGKRLVEINRSTGGRGLCMSVARVRPDEAAVRSELNTYILSALDTLPEDQRMVVVMRMIEGLSLEEVARALQCPVNTVRSRKILAIKKLRKALAKELIP